MGFGLAAFCGDRRTSPFPRVVLFVGLAVAAFFFALGGTRGVDYWARRSDPGFAVNCNNIFSSKPKAVEPFRHVSFCPWIARPDTSKQRDFRRFYVEVGGLHPRRFFVSKIVSKPSRDHDRERATLSALKAEILTLASRSDGSFLRLARCLRMAHEQDRAFYYLVCRQAKLGSRKAYYLVELAERLGSLRLPEKRFEAIGWTKAQVIAKRHDPAERTVPDSTRRTAQHSRSRIAGPGQAGVQDTLCSDVPVSYPVQDV